MFSDLFGSGDPCWVPKSMKNLLTFKEQDEVLFDLDFLMGFGWQAGMEYRVVGLSPSPDHHLFKLSRSGGSLLCFCCSFSFCFVFLFCVIY